MAEIDRRKRLKKRGFTLIELSVVLAIVGFLATFLFPALETAWREAKRAQALATMSQLVLGLQAFHAEYGVWPTDYGPDGKPLGSLTPHHLYAILSGTESEPEGHRQNEKGMVFMEFTERDLAREGGTTEVVDPWWKEMKGNAAQNYHVQIDVERQGHITIAEGPWRGTVVRAEMVIWDPGAPLDHGHTVNGVHPASALKSW